MLTRMINVPQEPPQRTMRPSQANKQWEFIFNQEVYHPAEDSGKSLLMEIERKKCVDEMYIIDAFTHFWMAIFIRKEAGRILGEDEGHKKAVQTIYGWIEDIRRMIKKKPVMRNKQILKMTKKIIDDIEKAGKAQASEDAQNMIEQLGTVFLPDYVDQSTELEEDTPIKMLVQPTDQFEFPIGNGFEMPKDTPTVSLPKPPLSQKERKRLEKEAKAKKEQEDEIAFIIELEARQASQHIVSPIENPTKEE